MDQDYVLNIINEEGQEEQIEVLDIFTLDAYPNKEYIHYTKNEQEGDMVKTYVSILQETDTEANLISIDDEAEFNAVQDYINLSLTDEGENING